MGSKSETGSMKGFLLPLVLQLLDTFSAQRTFSPTSGSKPSWPGLEITDPVDIGRPGRPLEDLEDLFDRFSLHDNIGRPGKPYDDTVACSDCSDPEDASSTTGISVPSTDGIGKSSPSSSHSLVLQAAEFKKPEEDDLLPESESWEAWSSHV